MPVKNFAMTIAAVASLGLAACGGAEEDAEVVAGEEVGAPVAPVDATADEALTDVNAAAGAAAENALDNASQSIENASESIENASEAVAE